MLILRMDNNLSIPVATTTQQHYAHLSICLKDVLRTCGVAGVAFSTGQFQFKPTVSNDAINQQQPSAARACPQQQQPPVTSHLTSLVPPVTSHLTSLVFQRCLSAGNSVAGLTASSCFGSGSSTLSTSSIAISIDDADSKHTHTPIHYSQYKLTAVLLTYMQSQYKL